MLPVPLIDKDVTMLDLDLTRRRPLRIGMIGYGFMGAAHSHAWRTAPHFFDTAFTPELVALSGRDPVALARAVAQYGFREGVTDWREVIARSDIDVIDICAPGDLHEPIAAAALAAGKHVLCEKPLANSVVEAESMADAARAAQGRGVVASVGFSYRFVPAVALARELCAAGRLGEIRHVRAQYLQDWLSDPLTPWSWRLDGSLAGSGSLGDIGAHVIDLAQYVTGETIDTVSGTTARFVPRRPVADSSSSLGGRGSADAPLRDVSVDDAVTASARMSGGGLASIEATRFATGRRNVLRLEVNGSAGSLVFDYDDPSALQFYDAADTDTESGFRRIHVTAAGHPYAENWWPQGHGLGYDHGFIHEIAGFLHDIDTAATSTAARRVTPSFDEGLRVQRVLGAIADSAEHGSRWTSTAATVPALT